MKLDRDLTKEEVYKKIKLTPNQKKAWDELMIAFKKCEKSGIMFYNCLETIKPMNGKNIDYIDEVQEDRSYHTTSNPLSPSVHVLPSYLNNDLSGFADDKHKIILKD